MHEEIPDYAMMPATAPEEQANPVKLIPAGDEIINRRLRLSESKRTALPQMSVEEDLLVPDVRPDLEKILSIDAVPEISSWDTYGASGGANIIRISGNLDVSTLYVASGKSDGLVAISSRIPFRYETEVTEHPAKSAEIMADVKTVTSRVINERKIRVSAAVQFKVLDYGDKEIELLEGVKDDSLLLRKEKIKFTDMAFRKSDGTEISEKIVVRDNLPEPATILKHSVNAVENHRQISKGKIIIEGSLYYSILYVPVSEEENPSTIPTFCRGKTDFTQFFRLPDLSAGEITGLVVNYNITSSDIRIRDGRHENTAGNDSTGDDSVDTDGKKYFQLDSTVDTTINVYREIERELVTDMYHRTRNLDFSTSPHKISRLRGTGAADISVRETITAPEEIAMAEGIPYVAVKIGQIKAKPESDRCQIEGQLEMDVIFADEGTGAVNCRKETAQFKSSIDIPGVNADVTPECTAGLRDVWFDRLNSRQIDFSCSIAVRVNTWDITSHEFIDRVCYIEDENDRSRRASMVVYVTMPDDTQWSIAKKFRTDMETIQSVNGMEEDQELQPGSRLLIV